MKKINKIISVALAFLLVFLFTFNANAYAYVSKDTESLNFNDFIKINELARLNEVEITKLNDNSFLIIENGEKTIIESQLKDGLVYTYYKNINNDIIDFTIFNPKTRETYLNDIQSIVYPIYDNNITEKDSITEKGNFVIIDNASEVDFIKSSEAFRIISTNVEEVIKYCPVEGSHEIRGNNINYSSLLIVTGGVVTIVALIKALGSAIGILAIEQVTKLSGLANAIKGAILFFGALSPTLSQHGVKITTVFVCARFYYYFLTQDWRVEGLPKYTLY